MIGYDLLCRIDGLFIIMLIMSVVLSGSTL
jgi:hypothetical protein